MINLVSNEKTKKTSFAKNKSYRKLTNSNFNGLSFDKKNLSSHLLQITIQVDSNISKAAHKETVELYKQQTAPHGFNTDNIPSKYIETRHKTEIINKLKVFLLKYLVLDFLIYKLRDLSISITNYPRLTKIINDDQFNLKFLFDISIADPIPLKEWKNFIFRPPKRKKYKDLDKQVENFIKQESVSTKKQKNNYVEESDWVIFDATLLDKTENPIWQDQKNSFCVKIGLQHLMNEFQESFIGKYANDTFITINMPIEQETLLDGQTNNYKFLIKIKEITKGKTFSIDLFKAAFKLKSKQEVHTKLIEAFSFKDDLSQRYSIIEELFHLLLSKHRFEVPAHISIRRQEDILLSLIKKPDYQVYRAQKEFPKQIALLAEQQLKEEILIDRIALDENIYADDKDIQNYIHLLSHNRLREFIHFKSPYEQLEKSSYPINMGTLNQIACREKTLNYIIYTLTK